MRSITLLCALACLVAATQAIQLPNIEEPEEDVLDELADDEDIDMGEILRDLFEDEEIDEDGDDEEPTGRQMATVTTSEQDRYNTFMDTLLSQLKRQARRDLEPLKVTLTHRKKNRKNGKKKVNKISKKNDKKNDKKEKNNRDAKDIILPNIEDNEEEPHQIQKREAEAEVDEEVTERQDRNGNKREIQKKEKDDLKKRRNNRRNKNKKKGRSNNKVILHGLSHIAREGDVTLYNMKNGRALVTDFTVGPVELDIVRKFGSGEERKAAASARQLEGRMMLKVNKQGNPRIKKLTINRPKDVTMSGSVARSNGENSGKGFIKKSVKAVSPTAAKKLLKAAKAIISSV